MDPKDQTKKLLILFNIAAIALFLLVLVYQIFIKDYFGADRHKLNPDKTADYTQPSSPYTPITSPSPSPSLDPSASPTLLTPSPSPSPPKRTPLGPSSGVLPSKVLIDVPFMVQAPTGNWDALHEEACEEASLLMLNHLINKTAVAGPTGAEEEIMAMVNWETDHGYSVDVTVEELSSIAADYFGIKSGRVETTPTITKIKQELAGGRPVIVPAAGRELHNPYFKQPGPLYHMLVIKGYDDNGFIVNDPGTKRGENFRYSYDVLMNAIHNWNGGADITAGAKAYLVFD